jgi:putative DNA methylase
MDRILDAARTGPLHLKHPNLAEMVVEAIRHGESELGHYDLHAFVVMPNHVHLLVTPKVPVANLLRSLKGITAKRANQLLGKAGKAFWQGESYDHWVRDDREFQLIRAHIENNPVKANLVAEPEAFPWSSGGAGQGAGCGPGGPPH